MANGRAASGGMLSGTLRRKLQLINDVCDVYYALYNGN